MGDEKLILIVDDDPDFVDAVKMILEKAKYRTDSAQDPESGYEKLKKNIPDLLILDLMMGCGAEGIIFARKMRKEKSLKGLPVLMITGIRKQTGFFYPGNFQYPLYIPVNDLVEKPVEAEVLLKKVDHLLSRS